LEAGIGPLALSSGAAAATYAVQNIAHAGDHIVAAQTIYGGTYNLFAHTLKDFGIETTFVDPEEENGFQNAIKENTKLIFIETLGNPASNVIDIAEVAEIAHKNRIPLIVDNTFATPFLLRPIEHGADIVVHSATKFIGGHGTSIGGVIVDSGKFDWAASGKFPYLTEPDPSYHGVKFTEAVGAAAYIIKARVTLLRDTGSALSPFNSFLFLQGLETLSLRVERHVSNTLKVLDFLSNHEQVIKVDHPAFSEGKEKAAYDKYFPGGAGSIFTFEIKGGAAEAQAFMKSLVIHPASTTHSQMTEQELLAARIKPNTIRLSIGTEHVDDLIEDLANAFDSIN